MFKGKCFQFKDLKAKQKFINSWQGQDDQQKAVAEFINWQPFSVTICTPSGGIRAITRLSDGVVYYTDLPEPLIDQCEIMLFFNEVEAGSEAKPFAEESTFDPNNIKELHRCSSETIHRMAAAIEKMEWAGMQGSTGNQVQAQKEFDLVLQDVRAEITANAPTM